MTTFDSGAVETVPSSSSAATAVANGGSVDPASAAESGTPSRNRNPEEIRTGNPEDLVDDEDDEDGSEEEDEDEESESEIGEERVPTPKNAGSGSGSGSKEPEEDLDTDQETDRLLGQQYNDDNGYYDSKVREIINCCNICTCSVQGSHLHFAPSDLFSHSLEACS